MSFNYELHFHPFFVWGLGHCIGHCIWCSIIIELKGIDCDQQLNQFSFIEWQKPNNRKAWSMYSSTICLQICIPYVPRFLLTFFLFIACTQYAHTQRPNRLSYSSTDIQCKTRTFLLHEHWTTTKRRLFITYIFLVCFQRFFAQPSSSSSASSLSSSSSSSSLWHEWYIWIWRSM